MSAPTRFLALFAAAALAGPAFAAEAPVPPPTDLADYIKKPDASFAWKKVGKSDVPGGTVYELRLTSQTWQGIDWKHGLHVVVPEGAKPQATMLLWNQGGDATPQNAILALEIAKRVKAPVAFLYGIPNQPIQEIGGNKKEDALIAETFVRFLATNDPTWPLLFPTAKSLVRTMDALQAFAKEEWTFEVKQFVVTGASKRGWTSWLTAASGDPRVKAIAPMVIDTLNFPAQMKNQVAAFGKPSEMVHDYTERGLIPIPETSAAQKLWTMTDPYVYREKLTLPKMLIHGTNDRYWPQDALNSYWDDLKGEKHVLYVPNAGHNLREMKNGKPEVFPARAINTLSAFARSQIFDKPLPKLAWKHADQDGEPVLTVESDTPMKAARMWSTTAKTRDFRDGVWTAVDLTGEAGKKCVASCKCPTDGLKAFYAEAEYDLDGLTYMLSTQIRIVEAKK